MEGIFFAVDKRHLVLHIGEINNLLLELGPDTAKLFRLCVEFLLKLIHLGIKGLDRLLEILDLLLLYK